MISNSIEYRNLKVHPKTFANFLVLTILISVLASQLAFVAVRTFPTKNQPPGTGAAAQPHVVQLGQQLLQVSLAAADGATIEFQTQNGTSQDGKPAEVRSIPHLVLLRSEKLTVPQERTLIVTIQPAAAGTAVQSELQVRLETQNGDPDRFGTISSRLVVYSGQLQVNDTPTVLEIRLDGTTVIDGEVYDPTPTGYYRLVFSQAGQEEREGTADEMVIDYAFLLENQWVTRLQSAGEPGPQELVVYYNDMTPFQYNSFDPDGRLTRGEVNGFLREVVIPGMAAIFDLQKAWGFEWHPQWHGFRQEVSSSQLTVALTDRDIWYHGPAPKGGFGLISINVNQYRLQTYSSLTDWMLSIFSHELFHNQQRNLSLQAGANGSTEGQHSAWEIVSEGTALLVESLTREVLGFSDGSGGNPYSVRAAAFYSRLDSISEQDGLPFEQMSPYEMVVFWRSLYDRSRGNAAGVQGTRQGLEIVRQTLEILYGDPRLLNIDKDQLSAGFDRLMERLLEEGYANSLEEIIPGAAARQSEQEQNQKPSSRMTEVARTVRVQFEVPVDQQIHLTGRRKNINLRQARF